jgi:hypothetical protein
MSNFSKWQQESGDEGGILFNNPKKTSRLSPFDVKKLMQVDGKGKAQRLENANVFLTVQRLIVIVPNEDVDEAILGRQIWLLASNYRLDVLLLSVVKSVEESMSAARRLTTLAAMIRDAYYKVEKQVVFEHSWQKGIRPYWRQTDMILCPLESEVKNGFGKQIRLCELLSRDLKAPVYTFSGLYSAGKSTIPIWLSKIPYWAGFILILCLFFIFEVNVDELSKGLVGQILLMMVVMFEIGLIYVWTLIAG